MSASTSTSCGRYARAVERMWGDLLDRPVVLSPRDWALVREWFERGIPLEILREVIDETAVGVRSGKRKPPRGLAYLSPAVEDAWSVVRDGRTLDPD